jgi:hypothetical protein
MHQTELSDPSKYFTKLNNNFSIVVMIGASETSQWKQEKADAVATD